MPQNEGNNIIISFILWHQNLIKYKTINKKRNQLLELFYPFEHHKIHFQYSKCPFF